MNNRKVAVGPGASSLILIAVVLSLSVLTVLTMISARSDEAMALRSVETRQEVFRLFAGGEASLAKLDEVLVSCLGEKPADREAYLAAVKDGLPDGMKMKEDLVSWTEKGEKRSLECEVRILEPGSAQRTVWTKHNLGAGEIWEEEEFDDFDDWGGEEETDEEAEGKTEEAGEEPEDESGTETDGEEEFK